MDTPLISFLIVNYKVADLVHQAIQSIQEQVRSDYEIIVLDNASEDGSFESLEGKYPRTKVIASDVNHGFGVGNNLAYESAKGEFIFLLNPDTILIDDSVDRMAEYLKSNPEVGMVSPMLLYEDLSLQRSIRKFYSFTGSLMDNRFMNPVIAGFPFLTRMLPGLLNHFETQEVDWAKGAALLIRRELIEQIGLFDPDYFIYGEEMDLCYRIGAAGWKKVYLHDCRIVHLEGKSTVQSSARMFLMNYKGMYLFLKKNFKPAVLRRYHQRVGLFSRLHYLLAANDESKKALYRSLIEWHRTEARSLLKN
jgi:hypothetical protein